MKLNKLHNAHVLLLCAALVACNKTTPVQNGTDQSGKTPIEIKVGEDSNPLSKAVVIDGKGKVTAFEKHTRLTLLMISEDAASSPSADKYTVTYGKAIGSGIPPIDVTDPPTSSTISWAQNEKASQEYEDPAGEITGSKTSTDNNSYDGSIRYWDDAHARTSQLSIYGFCINGTILPQGAPWNQRINGKANNATPAWYIDDIENIDYTIGAENSSLDKKKWTIGALDGYSYRYQSFLSVLYKDDICYSNNLANYNTSGTEPGKDKRLKFNNQQTKQFDSGTLEFHRAMSLITFKIQPGAGFSGGISGKDFKFPDNKNLAMTGFNKEGYLNIKTGEWSDIDTGSWLYICNATAPGDTYYTLMAFVIPGDDFNNSTAGALSFTIDGNEYQLSKLNLLNAIKANGANCEGETPNDPVKPEYMVDGTKLKAGIHYEFTFTVGKTAIDKIDAQIVDWVTVEAAASPDNAHPLTVTMENSAGGTSDPAASRLFKSATSAADLTGVSKGYSNTSGDYFDLTAGKDVKNTGWYWPDNRTFYHFRTISPQAALTVDGNTNDNYLTITGGAVASAQDYVWGAPLKELHNTTPHTITYDRSNGYEAYLYPAIGATKDNIHITQFHMMSDLKFILKTTGSTDPSDDDYKSDAVVLTGATVELLKYANQANLMVGKGVVNGWRDIKASQVLTADGINYNYTWRTVPQPLSRDASNKVGLKITLTDGNIYEIKDLSTLPVVVNSSSTTIPVWDPGKKYEYTLTLKKTAIDNLTATIVDWERVEATYDDVTIQ